MDRIGRVRLAGKGFVIDLDQHFSKEQIKQILAELKQIPSDTGKQEYLKKLFASIPDPAKTTFGYCQELKKHLTQQDCIQCSKTKNFKNIPQWESCIESNIRR